MNPADESFPLNQVRIFNAEVEMSQKFHGVHTIITWQYGRLGGCSSTKQVSSSHVKVLAHLQVQYFTCPKHLDLAADSSSSPLAGKTPQFGPNNPVSSLPSCVVRDFWFKD